MTHKLATSAFFLATAIVAACTSAPAGGDSAASESNNTTAREPLRAPTWTRCWVEKDTSTTDTFFQFHSVKCRYDAPDGRQPLTPKLMTVEVHDANGGAKTAQLHEQPGVEVLVNLVAGDRFPLKVYVHTYGDDFQLVGLERANVLSARLAIANVDANPKERPLEFKQPFDLWPVTILQKTSLYALDLTRTPLSIAPWVFGQAEDAKSDGFFAASVLGRVEGESTTHYFIAPKEGGLTGTYHADTDIPARIDAPAIYVADASGLRRATDEETGAVDPSDPIDSTPEPEPKPKPECGVDGTKCCGGPNGDGYGGTCEPGSFCKAYGNVCVACGNAGEKCCGGPNGDGYGGTCDPGAFCKAYGNVCVACGNAGEKCCGGPNGDGYGGTCEAGATCKSGGNVCVAN